MALARRLGRDGSVDHETWDVLSKRNVQFVRDAGAQTALPIALGHRIYVHLHAGGHGEWLRRADRRLDARDTFTYMRVAGFGLA